MCPLSIRTSRSAHALETGEAKLWILLVGVNQYQDQHLPSLRYPALDCQGLAAALTEATQAFPQKTFCVHHDFAAQRPDLEPVLASLKQIVSAAQPQDTVLFYFSGHGVLEPRKQQAFLCLADTQKEWAIATGFSVNELLHLLSNCAARQQIIWLDACHSGSMTLLGQSGGARDAAIAEPLPNPTSQLVDLLRQRASQSKGFYALLSCDQTQQSWEFPELGHGVFTYYLMRGLRGEAADAQGLLEADGLYKYVYYQTLQYIDKTNQQLRLINQQKRGRGETQLQSEYPLQTPKRIVEGVGELVLGLRRSPAPLAYPRQALVVEGWGNNPITLNFSKLIRSAGKFNLQYRPQPGKGWSDVREAIQACLRSQEPMTVELPETTTALLYLRGRIAETAEGESWLLVGDGMRISRSWLRQVLRRSNLMQQMVILDCPGATSLASWVEDLQLEVDRGQCLIAAAAPLSQPQQFAQALEQTLQAADPQTGLPVASWIAQLQIALAGTGITPHIWLSGSKGVIEVLPGEVAGRSGTASEGLDLGLCPYMGLRAFSKSDAQYFYGRAALTQTLIQQLSQHTCFAVVGASGSGKSSVVQAGLLAQLRQGKQLPGSDRWWMGEMRPGSHPMQALAQRFVDPGSETEKAYQQQQIEGFLYQGVEGFVHWLRQRSEPMVVLVVDQFEELFTLTSEPERQLFLALLFGAIAHASDRFKLVLTLRADFVAAGLEVPELTTVLQRASVLVPPNLSPDDYRQVIIRPAEQVGLRVEPELVEVLLTELQQSAGDLPLLEFVLEQLWEHRQQGALTLQAYQQEIGGLKIALERKAQEVYDSLDREAQACAQWIFLTLTQLGDNTEDTRRRVHKSDLVVAKYPAALVDRTLQALTTAKLIVIGVAENSRTQFPNDRGAETTHNSQLTTHNSQLTTHLSPVTVEVAHEILIRHWSTLRWWLEENRSRLRSQRQITEAAQLWQQNGQQSDYLLRGVRLGEAEELYIKYTDELPQFVQQFIEACLTAREQQQLQIKQRLRRTQITAAVIGALGIVACGFAGMAYWQQRAAQLRTVEAVAASATALLSSKQPLDSVLASVKAGRQLQPLRSLLGIPIPVPLETELQTSAALQQALTRTQELNRLEGHTNSVNTVSFSADGQTIVTASDDRIIKLWRADGSWQQDLSGHTDRVTQVTFSADGSLIASASADRSAKLWRKDGTLMQTITGHQDWVTSVSFGPNQSVLATASRDRTIKLWQINGDQAKLLRTFTGHRGWVNHVSFSPNGQLLASAGEDGTVLIWRLGDRRNAPIQRLPATGERLTAITFSPNGQLLATASGDGTVKLWNLAGQLQQTLIGHGEQVNQVRFSSDGKTIVTASSDRTIKLWQLEGNLLQTLSGHASEIKDVSISPDGQTIASASVDKTVRLWAMQNPLQTYGTGVYAATFSPNGETFAIAGWDKTIQIWQRQGNTATLIKTLKGHTAPIAALQFSSDGKLLASASADKTVQLWQMPAGQVFKTLTGHQEGVTSIAFSPNNQLLATGGNDRQIKLWQVTDGSLRKTLTGHTDTIATIRFSPDGKQIASGSYDKTVKLWNLDGTLQKSLERHEAAISAISFSPNGQQLASASWDNSIKLWNVNPGNLSNTFTGHRDAVTSLNFSPDGQILASGSADTTINLWNSANGTLIKTLIGHRDPVRSIEFNPDRTTLLSSSENSGAILWNLNLDELMNQGCDRLHNYLQTGSRSDNQPLCP
jgi:WD40 repeat protein/uncharacterized caspase-like protein